MQAFFGCSERCFLGTRHEFGERYPAENVEVVATMPVVYTVVPESRFPCSEMDLWQSHPVSASTICISPILGWLPADVRKPPDFFWVRE